MEDDEDCSGQASCGDPSCGDKCGFWDHPWCDGSSEILPIPASLGPLKASVGEHVVKKSRA